MSESICHKQIQDIRLTLVVPFEEIWFVQHMIESMDGLGLVTSGADNDWKGSLEVLTTSDRVVELNGLLLELKKIIGNLDIVLVENV
jgi:hypothetical protein